MVPPCAIERRGLRTKLKVKKGISRSQSAMGADRKTAGGLPGITLPGGVPPTYPPGARSVGYVGELKT